MSEFAIVVVILIIIVFIAIMSCKTTKEHYKEPHSMVKDFIGEWKYISDDKLITEILAIDYIGEQVLLSINKITNMRKYLPPSSKYFKAELSDLIIYNEVFPPFRAIPVDNHHIKLTVLRPTYAFPASDMKIENINNITHIIFQGKKYMKQ